jgi:hypothetical protein
MRVSAQELTMCGVGAVFLIAFGLSWIVILRRASRELEAAADDKGPIRRRWTLRLAGATGLCIFLGVSVPILMAGPPWPIVVAWVLLFLAAVAAAASLLSSWMVVRRLGR